MKYSKKSLNALAGVNGKLIMVMMAAITDSPIDYAITEGYRTEKRQKELYENGRKNNKKIVTYKDGIIRRSKHQEGKAVDIVPYVDGKYDWNNVAAYKVIIEHIKAIAKELNIEIRSGGEWNMGDWPHIELKG